VVVARGTVDEQDARLRLVFVALLRGVMSDMAAPDG